MSLVEALLLEPAPFKVWIAIRPDGRKGSGRIDDPYDGSTIHDPSVAINSRPITVRPSHPPKVLELRITPLPIFTDRPLFAGTLFTSRIPTLTRSA